MRLVSAKAEALQRKAMLIAVGTRQANREEGGRVSPSMGRIAISTDEVASNTGRTALGTDKFLSIRAPSSGPLQTR